MLILLFCLTSLAADEAPFTQDKVQKAGFFDLYWDEAAGDLFLAVDTFDEPFLFVHSLATGLGSNNLGLDRGQIRSSRIVHFKRVGQKVFLIEPNQTYRADSDNPLEVRAVRESFAYSVLWGADIAAEKDGVVFLNLKSFMFRDECGVSDRLKSRNEGAYKVDRDRSYYYAPHIKSFPDNTEMEAALTFSGPGKGEFVPTVTPTSSAITLHQRYSFVRLPDDKYAPRENHPRSGGFSYSYRDYAAPLDAPLDRHLVFRHRLVRKDPDAKRSELVEPLVYYVDSGAPKQIQDALVDGASWWNQAFEAAGIINGFRVEILPADADPMDVRYNVIQWVHRSTRGWSYGNSVADPRTGEIIKGHVSLGSLRVRQDRMIFEGMLTPEEYAAAGATPVELALSRIRQLSAHEVGHTLGIAHNFAASSNERASVMDYPAPLVRLKGDKLDLTDVYDTKIGAWDKQVIKYLYGDFKDEQAGLAAVIAESDKLGLAYVADSDGRSMRTMHPDGHVWDNGTDALDELQRMIELRKHLLANFDQKNLPAGRTLDQLEEWLAPIYLHHRYQLNAAAKTLGGADFTYGSPDDNGSHSLLEKHRQERALTLILSTLDPHFLVLPKHLRHLIPPRTPDTPLNRETFKRRTGAAFDELALAEAAAGQTLDVLLAHERLNRIYNQSMDEDHLDIAAMLDAIAAQTYLGKPMTKRHGAVHRLVNNATLNRLIAAVGDTNLRADIRAGILAHLRGVKGKLKSDNPAYQAHYAWLVQRLNEMETNDKLFSAGEILSPPPGSPIGN